MKISKIFVYIVKLLNRLALKFGKDRAESSFIL